MSLSREKLAKPEGLPEPSRTIINELETLELAVSRLWLVTSETSGIVLPV